MTSDCLILFNRPAPDASAACRDSEAGVLEEVEAVSAALTRRGVAHHTVGVDQLAAVPSHLTESAARVVFNLVEGFPGSASDANDVPSLCRAFGKSATGNDSACLALALNKRRAKAVLAAAGLPVPAAVSVPPGQALDPACLPRGPWIVKPEARDASEGISAASVMAAPGPALALAVRTIHETFGDAALVEQLVGTRELNVALVEMDGRLRVLPPAEIVFDDFGARPRIVDYAAKWDKDSYEYRHTRRQAPAPLAPALVARLAEMARRAWMAMDCRDYARVDFRLGAGDECWVLEVNPNPDISPDAGFAAALAAEGIGYDDFVAAMVANARARLPAERASAAPAVAAGSHGELVIRPTQAGDGEPILKFMADTGYFRPDELQIAREVFESAIADDQGRDYLSLSAEADGRVVGWICWGATPCTLGTWDVYWLAVDATLHRRGVGRKLMIEAEQRIRAAQGRLILIETAGKALYAATRGFYLRLGYRETARVRDFYAPGDDRIIYAKNL